MGSQELSLMLESGGARREHHLPPQAKTHLFMGKGKKESPAWGNPVLPPPDIILTKCNPIYMLLLHCSKIVNS